MSPAPAGSDALIPAGLDGTLVLLRHGETTFIVEGRFQGRLPAPLSPLGERQADLAAARLARPADPPPLPVPPGWPRAIVHSPLLRTSQVAERVTAAFEREARRRRPGDPGPPAVPPRRSEPGLAEVSQGDWEGLAHAEVKARYRAELAAWHRTPLLAHAPGGESLPEVRERVATGLREILADLAVHRPGGAPEAAPPWTVLVGHEGNFKVLLLTLLDLPLERFWSFPFALCGISVVDIRGGRAALRAHNLLGHLAALERTVPAERASGAESERREATGAL